MLFCEPAFVFLFLPLLLLVYRLTPRVARNTVLLVASLLFYAWGEKFFVLALLGSIALNYVSGLLVGADRPRQWRKVFLILSIAGNLAILIVFKYAGFIAANLNSALMALKLQPLHVRPIHLPIGISFFTFQALSYLIDTYRDPTAVQKNPIRLALYIAMFPQLIAGPIVRYRNIARQLVHRAVSSTAVVTGIRRFILGLGKKMLLANAVALPADRIFAIPAHQLTTAVAWLGAICYALQIYFDFSGYSDMAIGLGRIFGFRFLENFNYPYISRTITEFWRRWHISLSNWYRDYLYFPLGGNRRGKLRTYANLLTVFLLCGLWHGASWTFVVWGLFHGLFLILERLGLRRFLAVCHPVVQHVYFLLAMLCGWIFFRCETLSQAVGMLAAMAGFARGSGLEYHLGLYLDAKLAIVLAIGILASTPVLPRLIHALRHKRRTLEPADRYRLDAFTTIAESVSLIVVFLVSLCWMANDTYNPFLYFRF